MTISGNGKPSVRFSFAQIGTISSIVTLLVFVGGYVTGYRTLQSDVTAINVKLAALEIAVNALNKDTDTDRLAFTSLKQDQQWIKEAVGELRLYLIPKK